MNSDYLDGVLREARERLRPPPDRNGDGYTDEPPPRDRAETSSKHEESEPWQDPIPLDAVVAVRPFPVEVLPVTLAAFVTDAAAALGCPLGYVGTPLLAVAGAAIGASRTLQIKPGWQERPCLYVAVVGPPGSAKTPALKLVAAPVYAEQGRRMDWYRRQFKNFKDKLTLDRPTAPAAFVSDITVEKLAEVLQENGRGTALIRDELSGWFLSMNQYKAGGKGADKSFYLSVWAGEPVAVHRKAQEDGPIFVGHPFCAVVGTIPPDLLSQLRGEKDVKDGFLDRILLDFAEPTRATKETWACVSDEAAEGWQKTLSALWDLQPEHLQDLQDSQDGSQGEERGRSRPHCVRLDAGGRKCWERFTAWLAEEMNKEDFPEVLRGPWSKMRGYGARLALIVHCLRLVAGEVDEEDVDGESMDRSSLLVAYFMGHLRKVYGAMDADPDAKKAKRLLSWITREKRYYFKAYEPFGDLKNRTDFPTVDSLIKPLEYLKRFNYIRLIIPPVRQGPGRPPAAIYEVNPSILRPDNPVNPGNG